MRRRCVRLSLRELICCFLYEPEMASRKNSRNLFNISGFVSWDPHQLAASTGNAEIDQNQQAPFPPPAQIPSMKQTISPLLNTSGSSTSVDKVSLHPTDSTKCRISRREHNIIAPLSF